MKIITKIYAHIETDLILIVKTNEKKKPSISIKWCVYKNETFTVLVNVAFSI